MLLIIGLGNFGSKYLKTRHNLGFMAIDKLAEVWDSHPEWAQGLSKKETAKSLIQEYEIFWTSDDHRHLILAKPLTMMNLSGEAAVALLKAYKCKPSHLVLIHDDMDLPVGSLKISLEASAAGHKGVQSVITHLHTKKFIRVRLGIRPRLKRESTEAMVLKKFTKDEWFLVEKILEMIPDLIKILATEGVEKAMNIFNIRAK